MGKRWRQLGWLTAAALGPWLAHELNWTPHVAAPPAVGGDVAPALIEYERKARKYLIDESRRELHDRVSRAYGLLCTAQTISSEETMQLLSSVRMGVNLGLIRDVEIPTVNQLFIHTQPAHLQKISGVELDTADRNIERARYLRRHLNKEQSPGQAN